MKETIIVSRKNSIIRDAAALITSEKRHETGLFLVEGARLSLDAVQSGTGIFRLFYTRSAYDKYKEYIDPVALKATECYVIEEPVAKLLSNTKSTQGVFCVCKVKALGKLSEIKGKIIVLEDIQDPANLGSALRTGEALGINNFLLVGNCCDYLSPKNVRTSMGAVFRSSIYFEKKLEKAVEALKKMGYSTYAAVPDTTAQKITEITFGDKSAVLIGNEGNGLSQKAKEKSDIRVTIPMQGRAESLNAAAAAAIIMWEMVK